MGMRVRCSGITKIGFTTNLGFPGATDMAIVTVFVGLDYHKSVVQVCVVDEEGKVLANRKCENEVGEIVRTVRRCGDRVFAAIEACTGAAHLADEMIIQKGWSVDLAHPGYAARLKQSPDKSHYSDARLLGDLERVGYLDSATLVLLFAVSCVFEPLYVMVVAARGW